MITLKDYNFGIIGLSGVNINWPIVDPEDYWEERISGNLETRNSVLDCNLEDNAAKLWKPVGCLPIITSRTTHKQLSMGSDLSGLGHWF